MFPPILLFTYNKLDTLERTISALKNNYLFDEFELHIFSDGFKSERDYIKVLNVRNYIKKIEGFKEVTIYESNSNKGLANSIIEGVSSLISIYGSVIVLEDDLETSPNFLIFMSQAIKFYSTNSDIFSISGFTMPIKRASSNDVYFTKRSSSWGWATWKERWENIDWQVSDYPTFKMDFMKRNMFNKMGSDLSSLLDRQMSGKINSWAIRWCYHQFKNNLYTVYPCVSKIQNIGLSNENATHTNEKFNRFRTNIDTSNQVNFNFVDIPVLEPQIIKQFTKPYSLQQRLKYKIINWIF